MNCRDTARFQVSDRHSEISRLLSLLQFDYSTTDRRNIHGDKEKCVFEKKMMSGQKPHCIRRSHKSFSLFFFLSCQSQ